MSEDQEPKLSLERVPLLDWEVHPSVSAIRASLKALGFSEIGPFRDANRSGLEVLACFYPVAHFYGMILGPAPDGGVAPLELFCHLDEFNGVSVVNHAGAFTLYHEPVGVLLRNERASLGQLFRTLLDKTAGLDREPAAAEEFIDGILRVQMRRAQGGAVAGRE